MKTKCNNSESQLESKQFYYFYKSKFNIYNKCDSSLSNQIGEQDYKINQSIYFIFYILSNQRCV